MWDNKSQIFMSLKEDIRQSVQWWVNIWRNNTWTPSMSFSKGYKTICSRSLANSKQNKPTEIHAQPHHN